MEKLLRRIRGAVGMGLTWAVGWALVGVLIELITEFVPGWDGALVDMWVQTLAVSGFLGGAAFSVVLGIAGGRRRFDEMSMPRFATWGALSGLVVSVFMSVFIMTAAGFTLPTLVAGSVVTLLCTGSAAGSLALARMAEDRELLDASAEVAEVGLTGGEAQELLGGRG